MGIPVLVNPVFDSNECIIGPGLMTEKQYNRADHDVLKRIQDALDTKKPVISPILVDISSDNGSETTDGIYMVEGKYT